MHVHASFEELATRIKAFIAASPQRGDAHQHDCLETEFNALALEVFALQYQHNLTYQRFCRNRGVRPRARGFAAVRNGVPEATAIEIGHWTQIPAVPAFAFKDAEFSCLPRGERTAVFYSSGTTEQRPSRHFHNAQSLALYEASLWRWFVANVLAELGGGGEGRGLGLQEFGLLALTPAPESAPHSSLAHMFGVIQRKGEEEGRSRSNEFVGTLAANNSWELDFDSTRRGLESATATGKPVLIVGTAFSFVHLLDWLVERGLRFAAPAGSRVMETGGYKGRSRAIPKAELHALITERLGIAPGHIVCEYGMSELSSQAYAGEISRVDSRKGAEALRNVFWFPPWARARVISPETGQQASEGQTGLLRIVDLANAFSVAAIQTEDLAIRRGAGFELIGRAAQAEPRGCSLMATTIAA